MTRVNRRKWGPLLAVAGVAMLVGTMAGCQKKLFPPELPRSPYDRYSLLRGRDRPQVELDAYGAERPALRQRLAPLERP